MNVTLAWKGGLAFEGVADSGFMQTLDAEEAVGGNNSAARPMEYVAMGLAGCTGMDVVSILLKKRQDITDFQVKVHAKRAAEHPKVFTLATIEYLVTGKSVDESALLRAIELSAEKYCAVHAMLSKALPIKMIYKIFAEDGNTLLKQGAYIPIPAVE